MCFSISSSLRSWATFVLFWKPQTVFWLFTSERLYLLLPLPIQTGLKVPSGGKPCKHRFNPNRVSFVCELTPFQCLPTSGHCLMFSNICVFVVAIVVLVVLFFFFYCNLFNAYIFLYTITWLPEVSRINFALFWYAFLSLVFLRSL